MPRRPDSHLAYWLDTSGTKPLAKMDLTVRLSRSERTGDGHGWIRREYATRRGTVEMSIDLASLLQELGRRALLSRGKKARAQAGAIVVKVIESIDTPDAGPV